MRVLCRYLIPGPCPAQRTSVTHVGCSTLNNCQIALVKQIVKLLGLIFPGSQETRLGDREICMVWQELEVIISELLVVWRGVHV